MNIIYIHRTQDGGVESVHIWETVRSFKAHGHQVRVHSPVGAPIDPRDRVETKKNSRSGRAGVLRWISRYLPELFFELVELAYNVFAFQGLLRDFARFDHPVVYERYAFFGVAGALFARRRKCRWFLEVNYTSQCMMVRKRSPILKPLSVAIERRLFRSADGIVAVSSYLKNQLVHDYGVESDKILVLPNAADPKTFSPDVLPPVSIGNWKLADYKILGYVGGFNPWHDLDMLVRAFSAVITEFPEARLLLVGDGPKRPQVERLAKELGLSDTVMFAGQVAHDALPSYVSAFYLGILPNSNEYGSPMKIFEYMAMGKPVVAPDYAPLIEVIEDGRQGRIFQKKNLISLANSLRQMLANGAEHERMSRCSREAVTEIHNWDRNAIRALQLMESR